MGSGPALVFYNPTDSGNLNDRNPQFRPGERVWYNDKEFVYVQFDNGAGNVASADGRAAYWKDQSKGIVTSDKTDSEAGATVAAGLAGIFQAAVTDQYFTWLQTKGVDTVRLDGAGAVGNVIQAHASDTDLTLHTVAIASAGDAPIYGIQMAAADANNDAEVRLMID